MILRQSIPSGKEGTAGGFNGFTGIFTELLDEKDMVAVHATNHRNRQRTPNRLADGSFPDPYGDAPKGKSEASRSGASAKVRLWQG